MPDGEGRCGRRCGSDRRAEAGGLPAGAETLRRRLTGRVAQLAGQAAEERVAALLAGRGLQVIERRWRGQSGEIDLICAWGDVTVFVEVKASADFDRAAESLLPGQIARIRAAASEYAARLPHGQDSAMRFDLALVDGVGRIEIVENALGP